MYSHAFRPRGLSHVESITNVRKILIECIWIIKKIIIFAYKNYSTINRHVKHRTTGT